MRQNNKRPAACLFPALLVGVFHVAAANADDATVALGKQVAFDSGKGNCLACHMIPGGESPGNIGPPLLAMGFPSFKRSLPPSSTL